MDRMCSNLGTGTGVLPRNMYRYGANWTGAGETKHAIWIPNVTYEYAERMVQAGEIKGYLAYDNGIAIGWCNSNDRMSYYRTGEFDLHTLPDDEEYTHTIAPGEVKAIVCFEISPEYRGKGIATQFLRRICDDAKLEGYKYVEAYPVKDGENIEMAFTGPLRLYEKAGFEIFELSGNTYTVRKKLIL